MPARRPAMRPREFSGLGMVPQQRRHPVRSPRGLHRRAGPDRTPRQRRTGAANPVRAVRRRPHHDRLPAAVPPAPRPGRSTPHDRAHHLVLLPRKARGRPSPVVHADGPATPYAGTRSAGPGVLSAGTTHEVTGRVLRPGLRPSVPPQAGCLSRDPGILTCPLSLPSPRRSTGTAVPGRAGLAPARTVATGHARSTGLPSRTNST